MSEPYIGQIYLVGYNFAQRSFALCAGQLLPISQNSALFSLLGTIYGGDGRTTFGLPDLQGRTPIGMGHGAGLSDRRIGEKSGQENVTLTQAQMPSHTHNAVLRAESRAGNTDDPTNNMIAKSDSAFRPQVASEDITMNAASVTNDNAGGNQSHNNMQPYLVLNYEIALFGIFPSRS